MKPKIIILTIILIAAAKSEIENPVIDYKTERSLAPTDVLYKWSCDINGDGSQEVFLDLKESYAENVEDNVVPSWQVYIGTQIEGVVKYIKVTELEEGPPNGVSPVFPQIDPARMFSGQITQLGKRGIVTMQRDITKNGIVSTRIFAYTIENGKLKETTLVEYYGEDPNVVYDQYLADNVRTQIQLIEVVP